MRPTVMIVDDDASVRDSLRCLVETVGLEVEAYASPHDFLRSFKPSRPGCLVLDLRLPGMSGLELQRRLADSGVMIPIIFITGYGDIRSAVQAMELGAVYFLEKPYSEQRLVDLIQESLERDQRLRARHQSVARARKRLSQLTTREREVVDLLAEGRSSKMIAAALRLSKKTVDLHRSHIIKKLGVSSVAELVRLVLSAQALDDHPKSHSPAE